MELMVQRESGEILCRRCVIADTPFKRARGLLGRGRLADDEGLFLAASSLHTHFMRFPIDVVFVDRELRVIEVIHSMKPWRLAHKHGAHAVIELAAGVCERGGLEIEECLTLMRANSNPAANGGPADIRVVLATRDRRFFRVASFLLTRNGFAVTARSELDDLTDFVRTGRVDVVVLDGSESLAAAARASRTIEALDPTIGVVMVADGEEASRALGGVSKWDSFDAVIDAVERSFAETRMHGVS